MGIVLTLATCTMTRHNPANALSTVSTLFEAGWKSWSTKPTVNGFLLQNTTLHVMLSFLCTVLQIPYECTWRLQDSSWSKRCSPRYIAKTKKHTFCGFNLHCVWTLKPWTPVQVVLENKLVLKYSWIKNKFKPHH